MIVASMAMISSNDAIVKVSSEDLGIGQILFIRGIFAIVVFLSLIRITGNQWLSWSMLDRFNLARAGAECLATVFFVTGLTMLPIATASTLVWTSPILLTVCSALVLREKVTLVRWLAVWTGFAGVLCVTNPFGSEFSWPMFLPLAAAAFVVIRDLLTRKLDAGIDSKYVVLSTLVLVTLAGGMASAFDWHPVEFRHLAGLFASSVLLSTGFFFQIQAIRLGELSFIAPFLFTGILVSVGWGYAIWDEIPTASMVTGIALITGSGFYILSQSSRAARRATRL